MGEAHPWHTGHVKESMISFVMSCTKAELWSAAWGRRRSFKGESRIIDDEEDGDMAFAG